MLLRPYQREDADRIKQHYTFGIFNEQRTGKTPTVITAVLELNLNKILVVCPKSALYQWAEEFKTWSKEPELPIKVLSGTPQKRTQLLKEWESGVVIVSYDTLKTTARSAGVVDLIVKKKPDVVIADEAHRFKNPSSAIFKAMQKLIKVSRRYALTGTPAPGKPEEIYGILHWLKPDIFPSYWKFIDEFFMKYRRVLRNGRSFFEIGDFQIGKRHSLQVLLNSMSIQRKRKEVMSWLPEKDYQNIKLPLNPQQKKQLHELEKFYETEDLVVQGTLDRLIRYRQICLTPELLDLRGGSPKIDWVLDYIDDYPETPTIIFSKFTSFLKLLARNINEKKDVSMRMIIGETSAQARKQYVKEFQDGTCKFLLINIDAGKEALTLDTGECIIFTDQYPPVSDIQQAEDRFVATIKDKAEKPHKIVRLMMQDSYDENIYDLISQRASATDLLNDYKKYLRRIR